MMPDAGDAEASRALAHRPWHQVDFEYLPLQCKNENELPFQEDDELFVWEGLTFHGDVVSTCRKWVRLEHFMARHPRRAVRPGVARQTRAKRPTPDVAQELLTRYPWLSEADLNPLRPREGHGGAARRRRALGDGGAADDEASDAVEDGEVVEAVGRADDVPAAVVAADGADDVPAADAAPQDVLAVREADPAPVDAEAAVDELLQIRGEWDYDLGQAEEFFFCRILGGAWTMANRGVAADAVAGYAKPGVAKDWCRSYGFPLQASFAFSRYGREGANQLAREYCRRGHFFLRLWLQHGADFQYRQEHLHAYQECDEWRQWVEGLPQVQGWNQQRAEQMRALAPRLG